MKARKEAGTLARWHAGRLGFNETGPMKARKETYTSITQQTAGALQ